MSRATRTWTGSPAEFKRDFNFVLSHPHREVLERAEGLGQHVQATLAEYAFGRYLMDLDIACPECGQVDVDHAGGCPDQKRPATPEQSRQAYNAARMKAWTKIAKIEDLVRRLDATIAGDGKLEEADVETMQRLSVALEDVEETLRPQVDAAEQVTTG